MILRSWEKLPEQMRNDAVKPYYDYLCTKRFQLFIKRLFDILASLVLIVLLSPVMLVVAAAIVVQSGRPVFFRQKRVTQYGREFRIFKFRTMVTDAQTRGPQVTSRQDNRITPIGRGLRKRRLDEIPQLINILLGDMSFVGTRPEVPRYVKHYTHEMMATLLLPAGLTSRTSVSFKDEEMIYSIHPEESPDNIYVSHILSPKMRLNLEAVSSFSLLSDVEVLFTTLRSVLFSS